LLGISLLNKHSKIDISTSPKIIGKVNGNTVGRNDHNGNAYTDSGSVNTYVLTKIGNRINLDEYGNLSEVRFIAGNTNTAASTVNIDGLGVKNIKKDNGDIDLVGGEIIANRLYTLVYVSAKDVFVLTITINSGRKNILIGNFRVNQREVTGTVVLTTNVYGHDRFCGGSAGGTYTFATSGGITTVTITANTLAQVVRGENIVSGDYVLSWSGTAQGQIDGGGFGDSGEVFATLAGGTNAVIEFNTGTLALPQLEFGILATPFEFNFLAIERTACEAYFEKSQDDGVPLTTTSSNGVHVDTGGKVGASTTSVAFKVRKIKTPIVVTYNPLNLGATGQWNDISDTSNKPTVINTIGTSGFLVDIVTSQAGNIYQGHWTAESELTI